MFTSLLALTLLLLPVDSTATPQPESAVLLMQAVHSYTSPFSAPAEDLQVRTEWADVTGDGVADALVYVESTTWCGSGGCTLLVFEAITGEDDIAELGAFRPAAEISLMNGPIQIAQATTNGWSDLIVEGVEGQTVALRFDGETYPASPSGGIVMSASVAGPILFTSAE